MKSTQPVPGRRHKQEWALSDAVLVREHASTGNHVVAMYFDTASKLHVDDTLCGWAQHVNVGWLFFTTSFGTQKASYRRAGRNEPRNRQPTHQSGGDGNERKNTATANQAQQRGKMDLRPCQPSTRAPTDDMTVRELNSLTSCLYSRTIN